MLSALDKEANTLRNSSVNPRVLYDGAEDEPERPKSSMGGLSTRKSEPDFEKIDAESGTEEVNQAKRSQSGSWMPWSWGAKADTPADTLVIYCLVNSEKHITNSVIR